MYGVGRLLLSQLFASMLRRSASSIIPPVASTSDVRQHEAISGPMATGVWRPIVIVPKDAEKWSDERWTHFLAHEEAHCLRRDPLWQLIAQISVVLFWFVPTVHWLRYRLLSEIEQSTDDHVLSKGLVPHAYATAIVEFAKERNLSMKLPGPRPLRMVSAFERLRDVVSDSISRRAVSRRFRGVTILGSTIAGLFVAMFASVEVLEPTLVIGSGNLDNIEQAGVRLIAVTTSESEQQEPFAWNQRGFKIPLHAGNQERRKSPGHIITLELPISHPAVVAPIGPRRALTDLTTPRTGRLVSGWPDPSTSSNLWHLRVEPPADAEVAFSMDLVLPRPPRDLALFARTPNGWRATWNGSNPLRTTMEEGAPMWTFLPETRNGVPAQLFVTYSVLPDGPMPGLEDQNLLALDSIDFETEFRLSPLMLPEGTQRIRVIAIESDPYRLRRIPLRPAKAHWGPITFW